MRVSGLCVNYSFDEHEPASRLWSLFWGKRLLLAAPGSMWGGADMQLTGVYLGSAGEGGVGGRGCRTYVTVRISESGQPLRFLLSSQWIPGPKSLFAGSGTKGSNMSRHTGIAIRRTLP